jgi:hypothetical protein
MKHAIAIVIAVLGAAPSADAKGCHEHSDVVGFQHCSHFGEWSPDDPNGPRVWVEIGDVTERFAAREAVFANAMAAEGAMSAMTANAFVMRVLYGFDRWFYAGGELELGGLVQAPVVTMAGMPRDGNSFFSMHAVAGVHTRVRRFVIAAELAGGFGSYDISACTAPSCDHIVDVGHTLADVDARLRVDYFLPRFISIGVAVGNGLVDRDDRDVMVMLAVHARAMDGT